MAPGRFARIYNSEEHKLASSFHPMSKTRWLHEWRSVASNATSPGVMSEESCKREARNAMVASVQEYLDSNYKASVVEDRQSGPAPMSFEGGDMDDIFGDYCPNPNEDMRRSVGQRIPDSEEIVDEYLRKPCCYLEDPTAFDVKALYGKEALVGCFMKHNTVLPSSAPVERSFSMAGDILRPKRASMSDANLKRSMFLRRNSVSLRKKMAKKK